MKATLHFTKKPQQTDKETFFYFARVEFGHIAPYFTPKPPYVKALRRDVFLQAVFHRVRRRFGAVVHIEF
ncbi:MAG: hypothetical protein Fur002_17930 [Anaerolineales bacterium]